MNKIALGLLTLIFAVSITLTYAQDKTDSKDVKKPEVTKPADAQKTTDVTKSKDITTPIELKACDRKKPNLQIKPPVLTDPQVKKGTTNPKTDKTPDGIKTDVVTKGTGKPVNTVCIVSGEDIDKKITADYKGKTYAFCC